MTVNRGGPSSVLAGERPTSVLVWRLGTRPFLAGLSRVDAGSVAAASGVAVVTTKCCAWRWTLVARALPHGRDVGDTSRSLRSVVWERFAGQVVLVAVAGSVLDLLPSPASASRGRREGGGARAAYPVTNPPRHGAAQRQVGPARRHGSWAFSAVGLGAQQGVATAVVYGVMVFIGALPGAFLVLAAGLKHARSVGSG